eukprot:Sspe_Gene.109156::Locus_88602_Transcript_1_1_Confidence_1.000_Length_1286::g.109156::m.109156
MPCFPCFRRKKKAEEEDEGAAGAPGARDDLTIERSSADEHLRVKFAQEDCLEIVGVPDDGPGHELEHMVGRTVTHVNGERVNTVDEFQAAIAGKTTLTLRFEQRGAVGIMQPDRIEVLVMRAEELTAGGKHHLPNPFAVVEVINYDEAGGLTTPTSKHGRRRTQAKSKTANPEWDEVLPYFQVQHHGGAVVKVTIFDQLPGLSKILGKQHSGGFLGYADVPLGPRQLLQLVAAPGEWHLSLGPRPNHAADDALRRHKGSLGMVLVSMRASLPRHLPINPMVAQLGSALGWDFGSTDLPSIPYHDLEVTVFEAQHLTPRQDRSCFIEVCAAGAVHGAYADGVPRNTRSVAFGKNPQWDERFLWSLEPEESGHPRNETPVQLTFTLYEKNTSQDDVL